MSQKRRLNKYLLVKKFRKLLTNGTYRGTIAWVDFSTKDWQSFGTRTGRFKCDSTANSPKTNITP